MFDLRFYQMLDELLAQASQAQINVTVTFYDSARGYIKFQSPAESECWVSRDGSMPLVLDAAIAQMQLILQPAHHVACASKE